MTTAGQCDEVSIGTRVSRKNLRKTEVENVACQDSGHGIFSTYTLHRFALVWGLGDVIVEWLPGKCYSTAGNYHA